VVTQPGASEPLVNIAEKMPNAASKVKAAYQANRRVYGSPRVHAELQAQGLHCAKPPGGASDARNLRLFAHRPRHRTITTKSEKGAQVAPNEAIARRESPIGPTPNGWLIPPPFGQQKVGCTLRWYLMCSRGWW
jgi:hypothetical protein